MAMYPWHTKEEKPPNEKHNCGNCRFAEPSFNLFYCKAYKKNVQANETCNSWHEKDFVSKYDQCILCGKHWQQCTCQD